MEGSSVQLLFEAIQDMIECPVCHDVKDDLLTLNCGHITCRTCFDRIKKKDGKVISCPICRFNNPARKKHVKTVAVSNVGSVLKEIQCQNPCQLKGHLLPLDLHCFTCKKDICLICLYRNHISHNVQHRNNQDCICDSKTSSEAKLEHDLEIEVNEASEKSTHLLQTSDASDDNVWYEYFYQLKNVLSRSKDTKIPRERFLFERYHDSFLLSDGKESSLSGWVDEQRSLYKSRKLLPHRLHDLLDLVDEGEWSWKKEEPPNESTKHEENVLSNQDHGCMSSDNLLATHQKRKESLNESQLGKRARVEIDARQDVDSLLPDDVQLGQTNSRDSSTNQSSPDMLVGVPSESSEIKSSSLSEKSKEGNLENCFSFHSEYWCSMWSQMMLYAKFNGNNCDVPMDEDHAVSSCSDSPLSLGRWVSELKKRYLQQELSKEAAEAVASLIASGSLSVNINFQSEEPGQSGRINEDAFMPSEKSASKLDSSSTGNRVPQVEMNSIETAVSKPTLTQSRLTGIFETNISRPINRISRGDGVLYRYKSPRDHRRYLGIGVVKRAIFSREEVVVMPLAFYVEKDDKYKCRRHSFHAPGVTGKSFACLQLKWRRKASKVVQISLDTVILNQIKFVVKGYLSKPSVDIVKRHLHGTGFEF